MEREKTQILSNILGRFFRTNDEYLFSCPFCDHRKRKLSVNLSKNVYKCWICEAHGAPGKLVFKFGNSAQREEWKRISGQVDISDFDNLFQDQKTINNQQEINLPQEFMSLANTNLPTIAKAAMNYLKRRNMTQKDILKWKVGFCSFGEYKNRIIFPSFGDDGHCNYFVARTYKKNEWLKYKNPPASKSDIIFNELYIDHEEDLILVEGVFDAVIAGNAVPLLGSSIRENSPLFSLLINYPKEIFIALDHDAEKKAARIIGMLQKYNKAVYKIDTSDIEDVGSITKEEFLKRKQQAIHMTENNSMLQKIHEV